MEICQLNYQNFYRQISDYLEEEGISQKRISEKTGIAQNKLSLILSGKRKMTAAEYFLICEALKKSPKYFVDKYKEKKDEN